MIKVTVWKQKNNIKDNEGNIIKVEYNHNHTEDGWVEGTSPQPLKKEFSNQLAWKNFQWEKEFAYLHNGIVVQEK